MQVDPKTLTCDRRIKKLTKNVAQVIWGNHLLGYRPILVKGNKVLDGWTRVQAAIILELPEIEVKSHD